MFQEPTRLLRLCGRLALLAAAVALWAAAGAGGVRGQTADDHGNLFSTATPLALGSSVAGRIDPSDDRDVFRLDLSGRSGSTDVWIYTTGDLDTLAWLYNSAANLIVFNDDGFIGDQWTNAHLRRVLPRGVYYVSIRGQWDSATGEKLTGDYRLHAQVATDPGSTIETAVDLDVGSLGPGNIGATGDSDYFRMDFSETTNLIVRAMNLFIVYRSGVDRFSILPVAPLNVEVLDANGVKISANVYEVFARINGDRQPAGFSIRDDFEPGTYYFKVTTPPEVRPPPLPYTVHAYEDTEYTEFTDECGARTLSLNDPEISDPLYACQWHLNSPGGGHINAEDAWSEGITGDGVNVAIVDDGMYFTHVDLRDNVDTSRNHDYTGSGSIYTPLEHHGTHVAGIIAARDNGIGVRGVAPRATVYGYNFLAGETTALKAADAMTRNRVATAVSNNSWGPPDNPGLGFAGAFWEQAVRTGLSTGYYGKGVFYAFAGGNGHEFGDNSNLDEIANFYGVTAVCAVNDHDTRSGFSEVGANLWVCAPSNDLTDLHRGIVTTENSDRYYEEFGGTSAATPVVAGVAALMRSVNPALTWRDVKLILAASARKNDPENPGWANGARKYRASYEDRYHFNHEYGFGVVDAGAAVDLAKGWVNAPPLRSSIVTSGRISQAIPDAPRVGNPTTVTRTLAMDSPIGFTESVEVKVDFSHVSFRDLEIDLVSPSGAVSRLAESFDTLANELGIVPLRGGFRFGSARHLGEDPNGEWQLRVTDRVPGIGGTLRSWSLKVYGHQAVPGPPNVGSATAGPGSLMVAWTAAEQTMRGTVTAYDLRYVLTVVDETEDSMWTVVEDAWTSAARGGLEHTITGLVGGAEYDVQVRAVRDSIAGPWSKTVMGTSSRIETNACATGSAVADAASNPGLVSDCNALLASGEALSGSAALNWSASTPIADWDGVTVDGQPQRIVKLDLAESRLTGAIPPELGSLTELRWLELSQNRLTGPIPVELGGLANLEELSLQGNWLSGPIPASLGDLAGLRRLLLSGNRLSGQVPSQLGDLADLEELRLSGNRLTGCVPEGVRSVADNDLEEVGLLFCDVLLSGLTVSPGSLVPPFDPEHTDYVAVVGSSQVTIGATSDHDTILQVLDQHGNEILDGNDSAAGHQVDLSAGVTAINIRLVSEDGLATHIYTIRVNRASAPGAPVIIDAAPGKGSLTVWWTPPRETGGADIASYDVRHIESASADKSDANWSVATDAWPGGPLRYTITGLKGGTPYGIQVRAAHGAGTGPWSETFMGTSEAPSVCITGGSVADATNVGLVSDCEALLEALDTLAGSATLNWSVGMPIEEWDGITLRGRPARVGWLDFRAKGLDGSIPAQLGRLSGLTYLNLRTNDLSGPIPASLGDLTKLRVLNLNGNDLTGSIPASLGSLTDLREMWLHANDLTGPIPASLGNLSKLEKLKLRNNRLSGSIPASLGRLDKLEWLVVHNNELSGPIPPELGDMDSLQILWLGGNRLSGSIPPQLGSLSTLTQLHLRTNELTDDIPEELKDLTNLRRLWVHQNRLSGSIPSELGDLASLEILNLRANMLSGSIPSELGKLGKLKDLLLHDNRLSGSIPDDLGDLANLRRLWLSQNRLSGSIPASLGGLPVLTQLNLHTNLLSGAIPSELSDLADTLTRLRLSGNGFTGCIPPVLQGVPDNDLVQLGLEVCGSP